MSIKKMNWKRVENTFSEEERNYAGRYLVVDYVLDDKVEVSYFQERDPGAGDQIYINFDIMYGVVKVDDNDVKKQLKDIKHMITEEYIKNNGKVSDEFIEEFDDKYHIHIPGDIFFTVDKESEDYQNLSDDMKLFLDMLTSDLF